LTNKSFTMKHYAIIVAGGKGERMNMGLPKQFLPLKGKPILMHTLNVFHKYDPDIELIVVLPTEHIPCWLELCKTHSFNINHELVKGGLTRFESVKNGLLKIKAKSIIAVHDGVRPLVSTDTLDRCFTSAEKWGTAVPVCPIVDSLRIIDTHGNHSVDRKFYFSVQTPQIFQSSILQIAYNQPYEERFTDDATVVESLGLELNMVEGNHDNFKITTPPDLKIAELLLTEK